MRIKKEERSEREEENDTNISSSRREDGRGVCVWRWEEREGCKDEGERRLVRDDGREKWHKIAFFYLLLLPSFSSSSAAFLLYDVCCRCFFLSFGVQWWVFFLWWMWRCKEKKIQRLFHHHRKVIKQSSSPERDTQSDKSLQSISKYTDGKYTDITLLSCLQIEENPGENAIIFLYTFLSR